MIIQTTSIKLCARNFLPILVILRNRTFKVPENPVYRKISKEELPVVAPVEKEMIECLERLALVDFANAEGIVRLQEAIQFANQLSVVDTTNVEPMVSCLENRHLYLDEDNVTEGNCRNEILQNANKLEEYYFTAPLGRKSKEERTTNNNREIESIQSS